jgi:hypothetical protein
MDPARGSRGAWFHLTSRLALLTHPRPGAGEVRGATVGDAPGRATETSPTRSFLPKLPRPTPDQQSTPVSFRPSLPQEALAQAQSFRGPADRSEPLVTLPNTPGERRPRSLQPGSSPAASPPGL